MSCLRTITLACISLELFPFDFFFHTILCLLYSSKTIRDFSVTVKHATLIKHDETRIITLSFISLELFPFDYFPYNFVPTL